MRNAIHKHYSATLLKGYELISDNLADWLNYALRMPYTLNYPMMI
jgi:hypothetical protein